MQAIGLMDVFANTSGLPHSPVVSSAISAWRCSEASSSNRMWAGSRCFRRSCAVDGLWPGDRRALCLPPMPSHQVRSAFRRPRPSLRRRLPRNSRRRRTAGPSSGDHRPLYCSGRGLQHRPPIGGGGSAGGFGRPEARSRAHSSPGLVFGQRHGEEIASEGAYLEFGFFVMSHATQVGQTMIDKERHRFSLVQLSAVAQTIRRVGPDRVVLSSDSGSYVLPPPVEAFRELIVMIRSEGFDDDAIRLMTVHNTACLFKVGAGFKALNHEPRPRAREGGEFSRLLELGAGASRRPATTGSQDAHSPTN